MSPETDDLFCIRIECLIPGGTEQSSAAGSVFRRKVLPDELLRPLRTFRQQLIRGMTQRSEPYLGGYVIFRHQLKPTLDLLNARKCWYDNQVNRVLLPTFITLQEIPDKQGTAEALPDLSNLMANLRFAFDWFTLNDVSSFGEAVRFNNAEWARLAAAGFERDAFFSRTSQLYLLRISSSLSRWSRLFDEFTDLRNRLTRLLSCVITQPDEQTNRRMLELLKEVIALDSRFAVFHRMTGIYAQPSPRLFSEEQLLASFELF